jgi:hypothetical protein
MILDSLLMFDFQRSGAALTVGNVDSTNTIDLHGSNLIPVLASGQGARDIGIGDNPAMKVLVQVGTTLTSGGGATLQVSVQGAPDNGSGAPGAYTIFAQGPVVALASLVTGAYPLAIDMPRPAAGAPIPRFVKLVYATATAAFTGGTISGGLVLDRQDYVNYPAGLTISN